MTKPILLLFVFMLNCFCVCGQTSAVRMYIVNDADGYVNLRQEPGASGAIKESLRNNTVVKLDTLQTAVNGWIPVCLFESSTEGYIYKDRLLPIPADRAALIGKYAREGNLVYSIFNDNTDLFIIADSYWEEMAVCDLRKDEIIFSSGVPVCVSPIWDDAISFYFLYDLQWGGVADKMKPMFVVYNFFADGSEYDFYTEISPKPHIVSKQEADSIVAEVKAQGTVNFPTSQMMIKLFTAHCSGNTEAAGVLSSMPCDASLCHDQALFLSAMEAWTRSR